MLNPLPSLLILFGLVGLLIVLKKPKIKNNDFSKLLEKSLVYLRIIALRIDQKTSRFLNTIRKRRRLQDSEPLGVLSKQIVSEVAPEGSFSSITQPKESINFLKEETKLLKGLTKSSSGEEAFINLARLYLWKGDFSSARGILVQGYKLNPESRITQSLMVELMGKEEHSKFQKSPE